MGAFRLNVRPRPLWAGSWWSCPVCPDGVGSAAQAGKYLRQRSLNMDEAPTSLPPGRGASAAPVFLKFLIGIKALTEGSSRHGYR